MQEAVQFMYYALDREDLITDHRYRIQRYLSLLLKKNDDYPRAVILWQRMTEECEDCFAYVELAKYFEHKTRHLEEALRHTETALEKIQSGMARWSAEFGSVQDLIRDLQHRRLRLIRKKSER